MNITHGIDITNINRKEFKKALIVRRILSSTEYQQYLSLNKSNSFIWIAARWAIKEAFFKATNLNIWFNRIQVIHINNKPFIKIDNRLIKNADVSISYEDNYVIASIIIKGKLNIKINQI